jgi:hypothetical protein
MASLNKRNTCESIDPITLSSAISLNMRSIGLEGIGDTMNSFESTHTAAAVQQEVLAVLEEALRLADSWEVDRIHGRMEHDYQ